MPHIKEMSMIMTIYFCRKQKAVTERHVLNHSKTQKSPIRWKEHLRTNGVAIVRTCPDINIIVTVLRKIKSLRVRFLT